MLLVDSQSGAHPILVPRAPDPPGSEKKQKALAAPESAALALGGVELDESTGHSF